MDDLTIVALGMGGYCTLQVIVIAGIIAVTNAKSSFFAESVRLCFIGAPFFLRYLFFENCKHKNPSPGGEG